MSDYDNYRTHWEWLDGYFVMILTSLDTSNSYLQRFIIQYRKPEHLIMSEVKEYQDEQASNHKRDPIWLSIYHSDDLNLRTT